MKSLFMVLIALSLNACAPNGKAELPSILFIGDSVTHGQSPYVRELLSFAYKISLIADNARNTWYTKQKLSLWLSYYQHDVIVWNNGLWNAADIDPVNVPEAGTSDAQYEADLIELAKIMVQTKSRVIFVTTTDIPSGANPVSIGRELVFNEIAKRVLPPLGVEVFDLHAISLSIQSRHPDNADIHWTNTGSEILAQAVVKYVLRD